MTHLPPSEAEARERLPHVITEVRIVARGSRLTASGRDYVDELCDLAETLATLPQDRSGDARELVEVIQAALRKCGAPEMAVQAFASHIASAVLDHVALSQPQDSSEGVRERVKPRTRGWTGVGKYGTYFGFDAGGLNVQQAGFGRGDGNGYFVFRDENLDYEQDDGPLYRVANVDNSDLIYLRDALNEMFPPVDPDEPAAKVIERAVIEAMGWQPSETGTDYHETRRQVEHRILAALASRSAPDGWVLRLTEALEAADYLIDRLRRCRAGVVVRDLEEAGVAYDRARGLAAAPPAPPEEPGV